MAALLAAYESWKLKLDQAASAEEVDILSADAGKALTDLTATFTEGETAPDMDAAAAAALQKPAIRRSRSWIHWRSSTLRS